MITDISIFPTKETSFLHCSSTHNPTWAGLKLPSPDLNKWCQQKAPQAVLKVENLPANAGDTRDAGSIPGWGRSGEGSGSPPQYSCLENPMDRGAWRAPVRGVMQSRQDQSDLARTQQKRRVPAALGTHRLVKASETPIAHAGCWGQASGWPGLQGRVALEAARGETRGGGWGLGAGGCRQLPGHQGRAPQWVPHLNEKEGNPGGVGWEVLWPSRIP